MRQALKLADYNRHHHPQGRPEQSMQTYMLQGSDVQARTFTTARRYVSSLMCAWSRPLGWGCSAVGISPSRWSSATILASTLGC